MISSKCKYALKAMLELAKQAGSRPVTIGYIAERQDIPCRFLEAILRQLKQAGYTESVRGKEGGYRLAQPAGDITVGDVIRLIEGPLIARSKEQQFGDTPDIFIPIWNEANERLHDVFNEFTFARLVEDERQLIRIQAPDYSI
jgi:Rrf2 family protein